jgi:xylulokinase
VLVAGVDSSTQSCKVLLCDADDGTVVGSRSAPHPEGTECEPAAWWDALLAAGDGLLHRAVAVGVAGQQHGMIVVDGDGEVIRPALLWNDLRSAAAAAELISQNGGPGWWATQTGSVPTASFTITKLRWLAEHEPANAARAKAVLLPHDWLTWRLRGQGGRSPGAGPLAPAPRAGPEQLTGMVTDRGDASGTGYYSPATGRWLPDLLTSAVGHSMLLPRVAQPAEVVGETAWGAAVSAGTGDNMGAALGLGLCPGDVVVSIGTSGTAFAVSETPAADPSGAVCGFADATGRFLPLVCTVNAGLVMSAAAALLGVDLAGLDALALKAEPGAQGITLLPYLDGERTPNRPSATGVLRGLTTRNARPENLARAAIEALLASLAEATDRLTEQGCTRQRVLLVGGGSRSPAVCALAPGIFASPVLVPVAAEYVALGAARQAAWALSGGKEPPDWPLQPARLYEGPPEPQVRQRHTALRDETASWPEASG